jgi:hypothetical protein
MGWGCGRPWGGDAGAVRLTGRTATGLDWTCVARGTSADSAHPANAMSFRVPALGGEMDLLLAPGEFGLPGPFRARMAGPQGSGRPAWLSSVLASAGTFLATAEKHPLGPGPAILYLSPGQRPEAVLTPAVSAAVQALPVPAREHLMLWRDALGLHLRAGLPAPAAWAELEGFVRLGQALAGGLWAPTPTLLQPTLLDRLVSRL